MPAAALLAAFAWSLVFPLWRRLDPASDPSAGTSLAGLALLGWVALAGLPRRRPGGARALAVVGLALPGAALAAGLDVGAGLAPAEAGRTAGLALVFAGLLAAGADRAVARADGGGWHAVLWLAAVPLPAVLPAVALWGRAGAADPRLAGCVAGSPLGWVARRALEAGPGASGWDGAGPVPLTALAVALLLVAVAGGRGAS